MGKSSIRVVCCFFLILCDPNLVNPNGVGGAPRGGTYPAENEEQGAINPLLFHGYSTQNRRAKSNGNGNTAGETESENEANGVENETASGGQGSKPLPRPKNNFVNSGRSNQGAYNEPYHYDGSSWNDRSTRTLRRYGSDFGMQNTWSDARSGYTVGPYDNSWNNGFTTTSTSTSPSSPHYPDTTEDE